MSLKGITGDDDDDDASSWSNKSFHPVKKLKTLEMPWRGLKNRRPSGYKEKDLTFGVWII